MTEFIICYSLRHKYWDVNSTDIPQHIKNEIEATTERWQEVSEEVKGRVYIDEQTYEWYEVLVQI